MHCFANYIGCLNRNFPFKNITNTDFISAYYLRFKINNDPMYLRETNEQTVDYQFLMHDINKER